MRGEHKAIADSQVGIVGSSPHARGTPGNPFEAEVYVGIIPACAGNTSAIRQGDRRLGDHPRMRGEHLNAVAGGNADTGSSPHARGTLCVTSY